MKIHSLFALFAFVISAHAHALTLDSDHADGFSDAMEETTNLTQTYGTVKLYDDKAGEDVDKKLELVEVAKVSCTRSTEKRVVDSASGAKEDVKVADCQIFAKGSEAPVAHFGGKSAKAIFKAWEDAAGLGKAGTSLQLVNIKCRESLENGVIASTCSGDLAQ